ncbi:DUF2783 domain-containing protein [Flexibacterium corallicola]|uniref:DUF2783 domain-containing protein n=1 Tax=Flexibacterium corallicola TaxID=3037259 RepID=UPI00286FAA84|nr:DUF2783 domain-containing protein [Pseudovibrio sp. M1P-2-3]
MSQLNTAPNIDQPDNFYQDLLTLHEGRTKAQSEALNARLVLILANHIGDLEVLREAFALAAANEKSS